MKRSLLFLLLYSLCSIDTKAQKFNEFSDPNNIIKAVEYLNLRLPESKRSYYANSNENYLASKEDTLLIDLLRLGRNYSLRNYFIEYFDIYNPYDISKIIAVAYHRFLNNDSVNLVGLVNNYHNPCDERKYIWISIHSPPKTAENVEWYRKPSLYLNFGAGMKFLGANKKVSNFFADKIPYQGSMTNVLFNLRLGATKFYRITSTTIDLEYFAGLLSDSVNSSDFKSYQITLGYNIDLTDKWDQDPLFLYTGLSLNNNILTLHKNTSGNQPVDSIIKYGNRLSLNNISSTVQIGIGYKLNLLQGKILSKYLLSYDLQTNSTDWKVSKIKAANIPHLKLGGLKFQVMLLLNFKELS